MRLKPADSKPIETIINTLNINKAPGKDDIRTIDLIRLCKNINSAIANLISRCIISHKYPASLKIATVRPIYKKEIETSTKITYL